MNFTEKLFENYEMPSHNILDFLSSDSFIKNLDDGKEQSLSHRPLVRGPFCPKPSISRQRDSVSLSELRSSIRKFHFALITCINAFAVYLEIKVIKYHYNNLLRSYRKILIGPMESSMYNL